MEQKPQSGFPLDFSILLGLSLSTNLLCCGATITFFCPTTMMRMLVMQLRDKNVMMMMMMMMRMLAVVMQLR